MLAGFAKTVAFLIAALAWTAHASAHEPATWSPLERVRTIVIDPGHGGEDSGTVADDGFQEKGLTLRYALALREALLEADPSLRVVLTREEDVYVSLEERTRIANAAGGDLFLSIHFNAAPRREAHGLETFYLHPDGTVPGEVVPGQNAEAIIRTQVGVGGDVAAIVLQDVARRAAHHGSARFAELLHELMLQATSARDREVRAGRFRVLRGLQMPGVVLEVGFLSHAEETLRVRCPAFMDRSVRAMVQAVQQWDQWVMVASSGWRPAEGTVAGGGL